MKTLSTLVLYIFFGCSQLMAATLGTVQPSQPKALVFDSLTSGIKGAELDIGAALLRETSGGSIYIYRTGDFGMAQNGGFCGYLSDGTCMGDIVLDFRVPIFELTFGGFYAKKKDSAIISLFDGDLLLSTGRYFGNSSGRISFDFRQIPRLTRVNIQDSSKSRTKGLAYGSILYREFPVAPATVPLPAPFLLLMVGIGLLGLLKIAPRARRYPLRVRT